MKNGVIISENIKFCKNISLHLNDYDFTFNTDVREKKLVVLDLISTKVPQEYSDIKDKYIDKVYNIFKEFSIAKKTNTWASILVLLPNSNDYILQSALYFIEGALKSFACEIAPFNTICNCIRADKENLEKLTDLISFFSNEHAYMTAQILKPKFDFPKTTKANKKVALVTGSGQGIGLSIIKEFKKYDYTTYINDIALTDNVKNEMQKTNSFDAIGDISDIEKTNSIVSKIMEEQGRIDIFVANAAFMKMTSVEQLEKQEMHKHIDINISGHLNLLKPIIEILKKQKSGTIILFSSMFGTGGWKNASSYAGTKTAMIGIGKHLAKELKPYGISVCTIAPGVIDTSQLQADANDMGVTLEEVKKIYEKDIPLARVGKPDDVAFLVGFLCDKYAEYLTGTIIQTNGGEIRSTPEIL